MIAEGKPKTSLILPANTQVDYNTVLGGPVGILFGLSERKKGVHSCSPQERSPSTEQCHPTSIVIGTREDLVSRIEPGCQPVSHSTCPFRTTRRPTVNRIICGNWNVEDGRLVELQLKRQSVSCRKTVSIFRENQR